MDKVGQPYSAGDWTVKAGQEAEFVRLGLINRRRLNAAARRQLDKVQADIDPRTRTSVAGRLADWLSLARDRKSCCRVVLRLHASLSGTISEMDARSTDGD